ncbi:MAG TPA: TPM domain-containing protein [Erysipelotrichaceae bacterium]|jgi:uncharacterized protein|nr:TPM domain-containing protein [Erysipelotrichia bacterium]HPX33052.1 TPM domain-containing protein [Erysipelotrichaceae bacterium]HQA85711.1 TPM domain-containing protein [Erysipelotrichaceae bacterium]
MKRLIKFLLVAFIITLTFLPALKIVKADHPDRVIDEIGILTESERQELEQLCDEISERQQVDVAIIISEQFTYENIEAEADDYYDYNGYGLGEGYSGSLLVVGRDSEGYFVYITTCGYGIDCYSDYGIEHLIDTIVENYDNGYDWYNGLKAYINRCDELIDMANAGEPYDIYYPDPEPEPNPAIETAKTVGISTGAGGIAALIGTTILKGKNKSVFKKREARDYARPGSFKCTNHRDLYLYSRTTTSLRPKDTSSNGGSSRGGSSTHTSSSGRSHGGGGRRL